MILEPQKLIELTVADVSSKLISTLGAIHFFWGDPKEITETLKALTPLSRTSDKKFPLIALFTDIPKTPSTNPTCMWDVTLHLIIANATKQKYNAEDRLINNFRTVLYPIFDEFETQIKLSSYYATGYALGWDVTDRYYWGKRGIIGVNGENLFNDFIDCIEISNFKLPIKAVQSTCSTSTFNNIKN